MRASTSSERPVPVIVASDKLAEIQAEFSREWLRLSTQAQQGMLGSTHDRRFSNEAWSSNPGSLLLAHAYLLSARAMQQMVEAAQATEPVRNRLRFSVMQWVDALAPSNFLATNPEAQQALIESRGESFRLGLENLVCDLRKGRLSQTDESKFELGKNVGITPGAVVFENRLFQLIQYSPVTPSVYQKPLVIVPPCINKFYILDLQPENSFVRYATEQGFTVMLVSWRNPLASDTDGVDSATWDDYLQEGVLTALDVACAISGQKQINALGFCVGGTLLASALALAHAKGQEPVSALTLLTTLLDFDDTGVLDVFVDEAHAQTRERQIGRSGLMSARELGTTFAFLRPNELVWNYVVSNYLKGLAPPPFDLLFWNSDGTNLPGPFFTWYFRNTYLENNLKKPGRVKVDGHALDLQSLKMPAYVYGSREDHIVPWPAAYASTRILRGSIRFVLGASGHIAGVINPPAKKRRHYWAYENDYQHTDIPGDPEAWLGGASQHAGSWWPDWANWLALHSGSQVRRKSKLGNARYMPIEEAPGRYVKVRAA
ncbi:class I poly(R)-hydroxyalkanoic acid synthase [Paralcaligenes ureilyticus]|uniref:Polyhydroxyalkanoate synthase n=1 Tax=Paralcaligenes ureilyticus TaxID=627131 RepID=A0A4V2UXG1_9BURK|nr:class I poly(R)-hydroxyalkanoic acid synthase [Paralcaligenes ureilyticus]TCT03348.1 polyhydroxyalkanoate synthase [Paralcaligenes ureilyticus]